MMTGRIANLSPRSAALVAGISYIPVFVVGIFANFFVLEELVVTGDAATTVNNIVGSESLFRMGIAGFVIIGIFDLVIAWAL